MELEGVGEAQQGGRCVHTNNMGAQSHPRLQPPPLCTAPSVAASPQALPPTPSRPRVPLKLTAPQMCAHPPHHQ